MTSFGNLPKEVVEEIMSCLPADSLIRFKVVSKSWYALIGDPNFVAKHLENTKKRRSPSLVLSLQYQEVDQPTGDSFKSYDLWSLNLSGETSDHLCSSTELLKLPLCPYEHGSELGYSEEVYHCDGIIVRVVDGAEYVTIGNPVLQGFLTFPGPTYDNKKWDVGFHAGAFGYDSEAGAYKVVRLFRHHAGDKTRAMVYTLGGYFWREVDFPREVNLQCVEGVYASGFCYWIAEDLSRKQKFLSFDMSREEFYVLTMPKGSAPPEAREWRQLSVWNDGVVCFQSSRNNDKDLCVEVFAMEDSPDVATGRCSWTERLKLEIKSEKEIEEVVKFWRSDELLMRDYDENFVSYNLVTKNYRRFYIDGVGLGKCGTSFFWPLLYVKTLVCDFVLEEDGLGF